MMATDLPVQFSPEVTPDQFLVDGFARLRDPLPDPVGPLRVGLDLGTATIVVTVVDALDRPVYLDFVREAAVRDGVVVDFGAAAAAATGLRKRAEAALGTTLDGAATAYPPGVGEADARACRFVLERAGFTCAALVDEVAAAQALLGVRDGAIADVGGGSTGVGVYSGGELVSLGDLPGGGHHLNLILAGALGLPLDEAERIKRAGRLPGGGNDLLAILRPGVERVAHNIGRLMPTRPFGPIHLVGGAVMVAGSAAVIAGYLGHEVVEHPHALLVTPFGIALSLDRDDPSGASHGR
jgi:ethanolamine utilization protein EutJ